MSASSIAERGPLLEFGEFLVQTGRLTPEQLQRARERKTQSQLRLTDALLAENLLSESALLGALGEQLDIPVTTHIDLTQIDDTLAENVPIGFAKNYGLLPLHKKESGELVVVISDPLEIEPLDDLRLLFHGAQIAPILASRAAITAAINTVYDRSAHSTGALAEDAAADLDTLATEIGTEPQDLLEASDEAPIIRLVNSLLQQAIKERASDIHIEPFESEIRVRFRVDDILFEPMKPLPRALQASITSRIKIMGGLNIAEKRVPQDGRIRLKIAGRDYDVRLSTVPTAYGERVVLRLLPRTLDLLDLKKIGFRESQLPAIERLITRPNGIFLVTGPTGSGKTTTLYAALAAINNPTKNIITIEDPVEIQLPGVGQIEVNTKTGMTFARGLRSVLRQDPNVILVGEIRDLETAEIAIQASLTGHLVLATLHTNDAPSAITRLVDMGVEPFLVGSSLVAVLAQRLVRVLCEACKQPFLPTAEQLAEIGIHAPKSQIHIYEATGCEACKHTGYRGRIGIFELLLIDDEVRALVSQNTDAKTIKRKAIAKGMSTLRQDGAQAVLRGVTSIAEILRATEDEGVVEQI